MDLTIKIKYPGLGDHLFFSHLPRIAKESGYDRVTVSNRSSCQNKAYRDYIWQRNPYVDGFTEEDIPYQDGASVPSGMNLLDAIMLLRGLDDGTRWHEPELYFKPEIDDAIRNEVVFDPNFVTNAGSGVCPSRLDDFLRNEGVGRTMPSLKGLSLDSFATIDTDGSFARYCQIIMSCKKFICFASGGATLAAALNKPSIVIYGPEVAKRFLHSKMHTYIRM